MASGQSELLALDGDQPKWSPDGSRLYYRSMGNCFSSMTMPDRIVLDESTNCSTGQNRQEPTPDGSSIVYVYTTPSEGIVFDHSLMLLDSASGRQVEIVPSAGVRIDYPRVSPDGVWVAAAYECDGGGVSSLWAGPLSVRTPACEGRRITRVGGPSATKPQWGPRMLIAYERGEPPRDLAIIAADSGEECVIQGLGDDRNPSWGIFTTAVPE